MGSKTTSYTVRGRSRRASREILFLLLLYAVLAAGALGASELVAYLTATLP